MRDYITLKLPVGMIQNLPTKKHMNKTHEFMK